MHGQYCTRTAVQEAARASSARRQQGGLERSDHPQPQALSDVDYDDVAHHMAKLMQLYRSEALDTLRAGGGERRLWEAATRHLAHAVQVDPRTGEALLRVADGHTARSTHLLQALHVAAGASTWQAQEMPAVGLPVPVMPAVDFRCREGQVAQPVADSHQAQPEFLVGGHEALETIMGEAAGSGKLVVAAPDVASHVVHTRSKPAPQPRSVQPRRPDRRPQRRVWPAHWPLTAAHVPVPLLDGGALEGRLLAQPVGPAPANIEVSLMCDVDTVEGTGLDGVRIDNHSAAGSDKPHGTVLALCGEHTAAHGSVRVDVVSDDVHGTPCGHGGVEHRRRRVPSPRMLRVGIAKAAGHLQQALPYRSRSGPVQAALMAKVADRVLLSDFDSQLPTQ